MPGLLLGPRHPHFLSRRHLAASCTSTSTSTSTCSLHTCDTCDTSDRLDLDKIFQLAYVLLSSHISFPKFRSLIKLKIDTRLFSLWRHSS